MQALPGVRFSNLYGPTETNVCTFEHVETVAPDGLDSIPIGRAIADVDVFAVTDDLAMADVGETGELYVRGSTVTSGYWADPERTARALVPHPLRPELGVCYRTGDLVRRLDDESFLYLGRRDSQIKSRGYRIELGDIESSLYLHPLVDECAVVAVPDDVISNRIHAYVVVREELSSVELARHCSERVPRYMVPESFRVVPSLPRTSTGKVDRVAIVRDLQASPEQISSTTEIGASS